jgi:hypothetical protein
MALFDWFKKNKKSHIIGLIIFQKILQNKGPNTKLHVSHLP